MITRRFRQPTEQELKTLRGSEQWLRFSFRDFLGTAFLSTLFYAGGGWVLGKVLASLIRRLSELGALDLLAPALCLVGALWAVIATILDERRRRIAWQRVQAQNQGSVACGKVELIECEVTAAAELEEYEDEGPGFFLQVAPNVLLFLQGQHLMADDFPACSISLVRDSHTHGVFDLQYAGARVAPGPMIRSQAFGGVEWLQDGMFIRGTVDELPDDIDSLQQQEDVLNDVI